MKAVVINPADNVATTLTDLKAGDEVSLKVGDKRLTIKLRAAVPFGHKFSLAAIKAGAPAIKHGETIGIATKDIRAGDYVHVHKLASTRGRGNLAGKTS